MLQVLADAFMTRSLFIASIYGALVFSISVSLFAYINYKLHGAYKYFLVQILVGFVGLILLNFVPFEWFITSQHHQVYWGICFVIFGLLIQNEIIGFTLLFKGLDFLYHGMKMPLYFWDIATQRNFYLLSTPLFKTVFAFWIILLVSLIRIMIHQKPLIRKQV